LYIERRSSLKQDLGHSLLESGYKHGAREKNRFSKRFNRYDEDREYNDLSHPNRRKSTYKNSTLKRFLRNNTGRDWDEVFSNIKGSLPQNRFSGVVFDSESIYELVKKDCFLKSDGKIYYYKSSGGEVEVIEFYVHPVTRTLEFTPKPAKERHSSGSCENRHYYPWGSYRPVEEVSGFRKISENLYIEKMNGIWYGYFCETHQPDELVTQYDILTKTYKKGTRESFHMNDVELIRTKQLSKREIKEYVEGKKPPRRKEKMGRELRAH
jgi:hypothetical protein